MRSELAAVLLLLAAPGRAGVVERILAVVDGRPVLLSEVALFEKVRGDTERQALDGLIDEQLMYREAPAAPGRADRRRAARFEPARADHSQPGRTSGAHRLARRQAAILKYVGFGSGPRCG